MKGLAGSLCYLSGAGMLMGVPDRRLGGGTSKSVHHRCANSFRHLFAHTMSYSYCHQKGEVAKN
jgi:hypothetical protein